jgi:glycosyltransferase involved in cell wall biosynthesis
MISTCVPAPWFGMGTRNFELARELAIRHEVSVLAFAAAEEASEIAALRAFCADVHVVPGKAGGRAARRLDQLRSLLSPMPFHVQELHSSEMQKAIGAVLDGGNFDIVQLEGSQLCSFDFPNDVAIVLDEHNIEYEVLHRMATGERTRLRRLFSFLEYHKFRRLEQHWWRKVDGVAVTSDRELPVVQRHAPATATAVVPNAVDATHFAPADRDPEPGSIVFMGTLAYRPNVDAVQFFVDEVLPKVLRRHPDVVLTVVGHGEEDDLRRFRRPGVVVTGRVPDVRPYLAGAAVTVVPIRIGGGTRLKVVEALAMAKAVVSTALGCEGLAVRDGEHLLLADESDHFAAAVTRLLDDPSEARRLGMAGRALVAEHYSWAKASQRLEDLYESIRSEQPSR